MTEDVEKPDNVRLGDLSICDTSQPNDYIKRCGHEGKLKAQMTAVVYQAEYGKEYRPPTQEEIDAKRKYQRKY